MIYLAPLAVVVPLVVAAVLVATTFAFRRLPADLTAIGTAAASTVMCAVLFAGSLDGLQVAWLGGWEPREGVAIGISLAVDPIGSGLATLTALLTTAALVFSTRSRFEAREPFFQALMLVFLGGLVGFCLSADLFNLFVFFELISVAAYVLVGFETEETAPLSGALNFAVTNSVGASLILSGVALLYGRTGALNLAQIGRALDGAPADGLVLAAFVLITTGFFVKAAVVPFHFWLADAYSVAPIPVCLVLAGAVSELGLYAAARVYWTVFEGPLAPHAAGVGGVLLAVGAITALLGALMCFAQRHLKRLLAFATVSHVGLFLVGIALLEPDGLAGTAVYVVADGCVKASLFLCAGILQHRNGTVDELRLRGGGEGIPITGALFLLGGLAMASLPPFGPFLGKALIEEAGAAAGQWWVPVVFVASSSLTSGAVLRVAGRVWLGLGSDPQAEAQESKGDEEHRETRGARRRTGLPMLAPAVVLMGIGLLVGLVPGLPEGASAAAAQFQARPAYAAALLDGAAGARAPASAVPHLGGAALLTASLTLLLSAALAASNLLRHRLPARLAGRPSPPLRARPVEMLRALHSGHVGDYVAWLVAGSAAYGAALFLVVH